MNTDVFHVSPYRNVANIGRGRLHKICHKILQIDTNRFTLGKLDYLQITFRCANLPF